jgi:hypothetical protein
MLLPDTIPCAFGSVAGPTAPTTGNGWELVVLAHTDYHTEVCVVPNFLSWQFAKILSDKGSGTIVLSMDDPVLFPKDVLSLSPNADLADGLTGWQGNGAAVELALPGPPGGPLPQSMFIVPDGISQNCYAEQAASPIPVIPGQRYAVLADGYSPEGNSSVFAGMVFSDTYGTIVQDFTQVPLAAGTWTLYGAVVTAPEGAVIGWPAFGIGSSPGTGENLYIAGPTVTYESLEETVVQAMVPPPAGSTPPPLPPVPPARGATTLGDYLLDYEHLWQIWRDGQLLFDFTGQSVTEQYVDASEQRQATITGPGTVNTLSWARAMPPGFPNIVFKTDAIQDGFAEVDVNGNPLLDTNIWNESGPLDHILLNPPGTCEIIANGSTTFLGATPYDITGSSISAQINPPVTLDTGNSLNGSQVAQFYVQSAEDPASYALFGLSATQFYVLLSDNAAQAAGGGPGISSKPLSTYNSNDDLYWRISESDGKFTFWTSADGQSWVSEWVVPYAWDASKVTVFFTCSYNTDAVVAMGVTNINGDIITPSSAGNIFLRTPIMSVWYQLFVQAQGRGTIPFVTTRLNSSQDSFGNPWTDAMSVQIQNGTDLFSLLQTHAGIVNADWVMQPGFQLQVGLPLQGIGGIALGQDRSQTVILRESKELTARQRVRARDQVANSTGAVNTDGTVVSATDATSIARYGQREGWAQTAQAVNPASMQIVIAAALAESKDEVLSETISVLPDRPGSTPLYDYDVGDWIGRERPSVGSSVVDAIRVIGIAFAGDATGSVTAELTVTTYRQYIAQQLQYLVNKFGGQFVNALGTTPVTSIGGTSTVPTVVSPSLGGLSDVQTGTDHGDPLVFNGLTGMWQNASDVAPSGNPIPLMVGPGGGPKASLVPATGQTLSVDGGGAGTLTSAFQGSSGAASESAPCGVSPVIFSAGAASEQLGVLFVAGMSGRTAYALLLLGDSADGTVAGHARIGKLATGGSTTWAFTTVQTF